VTKHSAMVKGKQTYKLFHPIINHTDTVISYLPEHFNSTKNL